VAIIKKMHQVEEEIIDLDVGGTEKITTTKRTLCKFEGSVLEAMFSGRHELPKHRGKIFIDRDGQAFLDVVSYLRSGLKPPFRDENDSNHDLIHFRGRIICQREKQFYRELEYWQLPAPETHIH
jgi:hypothetical protein